MCDGVCVVSVCDTFSSRDVQSNSGEEQQVSLRRTWLQISCRAHGHAIQDDLTLSPKTQGHRTRQACTFQSSACELMDWHLPYQQSLDRSRVYFQLVSERERQSRSQSSDDCPDRILRYY